MYRGDRRPAGIHNNTIADNFSSATMMPTVTTPTLCLFSASGHVRVGENRPYFRSFWCASGLFDFDAVACEVDGSYCGPDTSVSGPICPAGHCCPSSPPREPLQSVPYWLLLSRRPPTAPRFRPRACHAHRGCRTPSGSVYPQLVGNLLDDRVAPESSDAVVAHRRCFRVRKGFIVNRSVSLVDGLGFQARVPTSLCDLWPLAARLRCLRVRRERHRAERFALAVVRRRPDHVLPTRLLCTNHGCGRAKRRHHEESDPRFDRPPPLYGLRRLRRQLPTRCSRHPHEWRRRPWRAGTSCGCEITLFP